MQLGRKQALWLGHKLSVVTGFLLNLLTHNMRSLLSVTCKIHAPCSLSHFNKSHKTSLNILLTCHREGRAGDGGQRAAWRGSAGFRLVQAGRLLVQEGRLPFGLSELVSGRVGLVSARVLDLAEWPFGLAEEPFGQTARLLGLSGLQDWAGSVGCVSGSWDSASLSLDQNGSLRWTESQIRLRLSAKFSSCRGETSWSICSIC